VDEGEVIRKQGREKSTGQDYVSVSVTVCDLVTEPAVAVTVIVKLPRVAGNTELIVKVDAPSDGFGVTDSEALVGSPATLITAPVVPRALPATEML
jgi:hypothetical protein